MIGRSTERRSSPTAIVDTHTYRRSRCADTRQGALKASALESANQQAAHDDAGPFRRHRSREPGGDARICSGRYTPLKRVPPSIGAVRCD